MHDIVRARPVARTRRRWTIGGLLAALIFVNYLERSNIGIALPRIRHDLSLDNMQVGMVLSGFQWTYAICMIPAGLIVDRFGARRIILAAGIIWSVFAAATGFARSLVFLVIARAFVGFAESPSFPAGIKIVDSWFPAREKASAVGMYEIATSLGSALAPLIAALLIRDAGWRLMFVIMGAIGLVPVLFWWLRYQKPEDDKFLSPQERALILSGRHDFNAKTPSLAEWWGLFARWQTWTMFAGGLSYAGMLGFYAWLPIYLQENWHFSVVHAGRIMTSLGLFGIVGVVTGATLSDLLIRRGLRAFHARRIVIVGGALLGALATGVTLLSGSGAVMSVAFAGAIFSSGFIAPAWWSLVPTVSPNDRLVASLSSLQNAGNFLGGAIAPLLIGWLSDRHYDYHGIVAFSACFGLAHAVIYGILLHRPIDPL